MEGIDYKKELQEFWDFVFNDWRLKKLKYIDEHVFYNRIYKNLKKLGDIRYKEYKCGAVEFGKILEKMDNLILKPSGYHSGSQIFMFNWICLEFKKAVVENTNIYLKKQLKEEYSREEEIKNNKIIYIFQELKKDADYINFNNNLISTIRDDKKMYTVKNIPLFTDSITSTKVDTLWHGTKITNATSIIQMGYLQTNNNILFNKNKVFFSDNVCDAITYAKRWSYESIHILFKFNLKHFDVHKREHMLSNRDGDLYFVKCDKMPIENYIEEVYLLDENGNVRKTSIEEIIELNNEREQLKLLKVKKQYKQLTGKEVSVGLGLPDDELGAKEYKKINSDNLRLFHTTSIDNCAKIFEEDFIKGNIETETGGFNYNKIFLSDNIDYSRDYGRAINIHNNYTMLEIDLTGYDVYVHWFHNEYFVIGDIKVDAIKKVYRFKNDKLIATLNKEV